MKAAKLLIALGGGLLVLVLLVVVIVFISIDKIAKTGIEKGTNYALAVPTSLDKADVGILDGTFAMSGLTIDNPEGYDSPFFFKLGSGDVAVSLASLRSDVVTLPLFELTDLTVNIDRKGTTSNVHKILENLKRFEKGEPAEPGEPKPEAKEGKKFVVNEIAIKNVTINANLLPLGGELATTKLVIPEILLKDVGSAGNPVSLAELTNIITQAVLASAAEFGGGIIPEEILGDLKTNLDGLNALAENGVEILTTEVDKALDEAQKQLDEKAEELQDKAKDAVNKGLNDLLGGNKDKKKEGGG